MFLDFVHCPVFSQEHNVSETGSVPILGTIKVAPTLLGPLERASLNHCNCI
jgi:hypothetical protein